MSIETAAYLQDPDKAERIRNEHTRAIQEMARLVIENDLTETLEGVDDSYYNLFLPSLEELETHEAR